MTPIQKKYKKAYAIELLKIAIGDLASAKFLSNDRDGRIANFFYLIQQSIEKCLKAVLCHREKQIVHTHDIAALLVLLPQSDQFKNPKSLEVFTEYATVRRYEEGYEEVTDKDIENALRLGQEVIDWAKAIIS